jgi:hypothetical protein
VSVPSVTAARIWLEDLLENAGLPVVRNAGALVNAPGVGIFAGDPWLEPLPSLGPPVRRVRWVVRILGGLADRGGTLDQLGTMMPAAVVAIQSAHLELVDGRVSGPRQLPLDGSTYLAVDLAVRMQIDLEAPPAPRSADPGADPGAPDMEV